MNKHTPGPWVADINNNVVRKYSARRKSAPFGVFNIVNAQGIILASFSHGDAPKSLSEQEEANAKLMAAAPELLKTMQALLGVIEMVNGRDDVLVVETVEAHLRAAIAKATGETP